MGQAFTDSRFQQSGVFRRLSNSLFPQIYYKRLTPIPSGWSAYSNMLYTWASASNLLGVDFKLYESYSDLLTDTSAWQFCNYDSGGVGAFRDCGPTGFVPYHWNGFQRDNGILDYEFDVLLM
jgi:hypothetical protein